MIDRVAVRMAARQAVAVCGALIVVAACSSNSSKTANPGPTLATEPPRTTTTEPYAVPSVIDAAYVNRVLAGLDSIAGDVVRLVAQSRTIPPSAITRLRSLYSSDRRLQLEIDILQNDMRGGFANYRLDAGNPTTVVDELLTISPRCIFSRVRRDYRPVAITVDAPERQWVAIVPIDPARDPNGYNPTPWAYIYNGFQSNGMEPSNPCVT